MSVYIARRKDGSAKSPYFQFDFVCKINGERRRFHGSTGETTERAARKYEATEKARVKSEGPNDVMTIAAACYRYSAEIGPNIASADDLDKAFEHICRLIGGDRKLVNLTADDIATAVRRRAAETVGIEKPRLITPATVNRQIVEPIKRLLRRAAVVWRVNCRPDLMPWKDLRLKEPTERVRELTAEEGTAFWSALREDYRPLVVFLAIRGFRVRSAIAMQNFDIDFANLRVRAWKKKVGKVWFPIAQQQAEIIRTEMRLAPESKSIWTYVVQKKRGNRKAGERQPITYSGLRRVINNAFSDAGIMDFHIHDLRHDFASKLLRKVKDVAKVQKALGHSDIKSTMRYAHVLDDDVRDALGEMKLPELPRNEIASIIKIGG